MIGHDMSPTSALAARKKVHAVTIATRAKDTSEKNSKTIQFIDELLEHGASGDSSLVYGMWAGKDEVVKHMLTHENMLHRLSPETRVPLDERGLDGIGNGETALIAAVFINNVAMIRFLLEECDPPARTDAMYEDDFYRGETALHVAAAQGFVETAALLIEHGAPLDGVIRNVQRMPRVPKWRIPGWIEHRVEGSFFDPRKNTNKVCYIGETPLSFAACMGHRSMVALLLRMGADPNVKDGQGNTVLHMMVLRDNRPLEERCLFFGACVENGADPTIQNNEGYTPLLLTIRQGNRRFFEQVVNTTKRNLWCFGKVASYAYSVQYIDSAAYRDHLKEEKERVREDAACKIQSSARGKRTRQMIYERAKRAGINPQILSRCSKRMTNSKTKLKKLKNRSKILVRSGSNAAASLVAIAANKIHDQAAAAAKAVEHAAQDGIMLLNELVEEVDNVLLDDEQEKARDMERDLENFKKSQKDGVFFMTLRQQRRRKIVCHSSGIEMILRYKQLYFLEVNIVHELLEDKWRKYGKRMHNFAAFYYAVYLLIVSCTMLMRPWREPWMYHFSSHGSEWTRLLLECTMMLSVALGIRNELQEKSTEGWRHYFTNMWNILQWLHFGSVITIAVGRVIMIVATWDDRARYGKMSVNDLIDELRDGQGLALAMMLETPAVITACVSSFTYALYFMSTMKSVGPLLVMLYQMIVTDMVVFFYIYSITFLGISLSFYTLYQTQDLSLMDSLFMTFRLLLADFDWDHIESGSDFPVWTILMFIFVIILTSIILLNLLIAMFSSTYSNTIEHATMQWRLQWAKTIIRMEKQLSLKQLKTLEILYPRSELVTVVDKQQEEDRVSNILDQPDAALIEDADQSLVLPHRRSNNGLLLGANLRNLKRKRRSDEDEMQKTILQALRSEQDRALLATNPEDALRKAANKGGGIAMRGLLAKKGSLMNLNISQSSGWLDGRRKSMRNLAKRTPAMPIREQLEMVAPMVHGRSRARSVSPTRGFSMWNKS
jgi:hypothetical protein